MFNAVKPVQGVIFEKNVHFNVINDAYKKEGKFLEIG